MKTTVWIEKEMVPSQTASPRATAPVVAAAVVACALALAVTGLWLLWLGHPPATASLGALADTALAERVLAALRWYLTHAPHGLTIPLMHPVVGGPAVDLMMVEPETVFA